MNSRLIFLNENIDFLREMLQFLLRIYAPSCQMVVDCSQELDKLLSEYENEKNRISHAA